MFSVLRVFLVYVFVILLYDQNWEMFYFNIIYFNVHAQMSYCFNIGKVKFGEM